MISRHKAQKTVFGILTPFVGQRLALRSVNDKGKKPKKPVSSHRCSSECAWLGADWLHAMADWYIPAKDTMDCRANGSRDYGSVVRLDAPAHYCDFHSLSHSACAFPSHFTLTEKSLPRLPPTLCMISAYTKNASSLFARSLMNPSTASSKPPRKAYLCWTVSSRNLPAYLLAKRVSSWVMIAWLIGDWSSHDSLRPTQSSEAIYFLQRTQSRIGRLGLRAHASHESGFKILLRSPNLSRFSLRPYRSPCR